MLNPIIFTVTDSGRDAIYDAVSNGIKLSIIKVGLGAGQYVPAKTRKSLASEFTQKTISAGGVELESFALRFTVIMNYAIEKNVSEVGLYTGTGVLFAVASLPEDSYFRLYPGIDFVANMGLLLETEFEANAIDVVLDGNAELATQIMSEHLIAADPHPQYRQYSEQLIQEHLAAADPHPQYALKSFLNDQLAELDGKIDTLLNVTDYVFPNRLMCGYDITDKMVTTRKKGAVYSLSDTSLVYLYSPEAQHEAWLTTRETEKITTNVYNRSGTGQSTYVGRSNYALIETEQVLQKNGFAAESNQLQNLIKAGTLEAGQNAVIQKTAEETLSYDSNDLIVLISPEGAHEGWTITRTADKITIDVYSRTGTIRGAYSGRINWALFKANNIPPAVRDQYPINLTAGMANGASFKITAPASFDFTDPIFFPVITPEGQNEGWTITRTSTGFDVNVFNRSGTSQATYTGKVGWAVFVIDRPMKRTVYYEGDYQITVPAGKLARFALCGPGGGGGASRSTSIAGPIDGSNGESTKITRDSLEVSAGGGDGGTGGWWGNGSHYDNGHAGAGGINLISNLIGGMTVLKDIPGNAAVIGSRWSQQPGGVATSADSGLAVANTGGVGAWGIGDERWSYGGGGGSGGYVLVEFKNTTGKDVVFDLTVGEAGTGGITGNTGGIGGVGFAIITEEI